MTRQMKIKRLPNVFLILALALGTTGFAALANEEPEMETTGDAAGAVTAEVAPVTLSVRDMEINELLSMFSSSRKINIVSSEDVTGRVSIELHDVPFEKALNSIIAMVGCQVVHRDNIYFVHAIAGDDPGESLLKDVRTYRLDYAPVGEIQTVVTQILSRVGRVTNYPPLRTIVVEDRPDVLDRVGQVIEDLDRAPRQVLIEANIIEARLSRDMTFGIDWSLLFSPGEGSGTFRGDGFTTPPTVRTDGIFVAWGKGDFQATLETIEGIDELNTLANPRLLAVDGTEAEIISGGQLGFSVVTTVDNTVIQSVEFLDIGAQLRITPTITADGYILMKIHPELSDGVVEEGLPSKTTAEVTTEVLVKNGDTLFIGGLIRERTEEIRRGIPLLVRIPLLGALFGKTIHTTIKSELIALITPTIIEPGDGVEY
jgi:type II secretory pathway component GspD/PulD (secretin)